MGTNKGLKKKKKSKRTHTPKEINKMERKKKRRSIFVDVFVLFELTLVYSFPNTSI